MENASKALLIAGGVLIAIIIISLLVRTYGNISLFQKQQLTEQEAEQLAEFNADYTKYQNQYVYGTEVITVINRTLNYQTKQGANINVEITFINPYIYMKKEINNIILKNDGDKYDFLDFTINNTNTDNGDDIKNRAFQCTGIDYDNTTGRVNYIKFDEKQIT